VSKKLKRDMETEINRLRAELQTARLTLAFASQAATHIANAVAALGKGSGK
jgi:hypothetical protein